MTASVRASAHVLAMLEDGAAQVLDIGGGFGAQARLRDAAPIIRDALAQHVAPWWPRLRVMAEPGRFFVERAATIFTPVIGKHVRGVAGVRNYFITDGLYGSLNCVLYDGHDPPVTVFRRASAGRERRESNVWGPTCDSVDIVAKGILLPELEIGDCLAFRDVGAYTVSGACDFNGMPMSTPITLYVGEDEDADADEDADEDA